MNARRAIRVCLMGALLPSDTLTASASGRDPDVSPASAALRVAIWAAALPIERSPDHHVTGRRAVMFREFPVNVLTLTLALAMECACPSTACHRDPEGTRG